MAQILFTEVPELSAFREEHIDYHFGDMLPHVFFGDVTRWAEDRDPAQSQALQRLLVFLETSYATANDYVRELITVSFLENLTEGGAVAAALGPTLAAILESFGEQST